MVVVMEERATEAQIESVVARLVEMGMDVHRSTGVTRTVVPQVAPVELDRYMTALWLQLLLVHFSKPTRNPLRYVMLGSKLGYDEAGLSWTTEPHVEPAFELRRMAV